MMAKIGMLSSMVNGKRVGFRPGNPVGTLGPPENTLGYPEFLKRHTRDRPSHNTSIKLYFGYYGIYPSSY